MKESGSARLNELYTKAAHYNEHSRTKYGRELLNHTVEDLAYVTAKVRSSMVQTVIMFLTPLEISQCCMRVVVNHMMGDVNRSKLAADMRDAMKAQIETNFIEQHIYKGRQMMKNLSIVSNTRDARLKIIANNKRKRNVQFIMPNDRVLMATAMWFIAIMVHHPYCPVEESRVKLKRHYQIHYSLKAGVLDWVRDKKLKEVEASPWYMPLDSPPPPWESVLIGGYPEGVASVRFTRSRDDNWELQQPWDYFKPAADAANHIASIPHSVNGWVYNCVLDMYRKPVQVQRLSRLGCA